MKRETPENSCPGEFGTDFNIYEKCLDCPHSDLCRKKHRNSAKFEVYSIEFLQIPIALAVDKNISCEEKILIAAFQYTYKKELKASKVTNRTLSKITGLSESAVSRGINGYKKNGKHYKGLIERGYLKREYGGIILTIYTLRLWNKYREKPVNPHAAKKSKR